MATRDYTSAPISDQLGIPSIISGLCGDLEQLRKGQISVNDAMARSMLAKQIFNGVRLYMNGTKLLSENASPARAIDTSSNPHTQEQAR
jgi:hypothetical protein